MVKVTNSAMNVFQSVYVVYALDAACTIDAAPPLDRYTELHTHPSPHAHSSGQVATSIVIG